MKKTETVAEFLARGGKINKVPVQQLKRTESARATPVSGPSTIVTMDEADLYHGETKKNKSTKKKNNNERINISDLPEELRCMLPVEALNGEDDED